MIGFYLLSTAIPVLLVWSLWWLRRWRNFRVYFWSNFLLALLYLTVFGFLGSQFFDQDPYGLKKIALIFFALLTHAVGSFIFALLFRFKYAAQWEPTEKS